MEPTTQNKSWLMMALVKASLHYSVEINESMHDDYWHALKHFDRERMKIGFRKFVGTYKEKFFPTPGQLRGWFSVYMNDTKPAVRSLPEPEATPDMKRFLSQMRHFYCSVVPTGNVSSKDSYMDWMKTKYVKCDKHGCTKCATVCDPDWVDRNYKLINEGELK